MTADPLETVEVVTGDRPSASVIWLHGLGADGHDFEPIVPLLGLGASPAVRFVFPHAPRRPVTINAGLIMPAWYDIRALSLRRDVDAEGLASSAQAIEALIAREQRRGIATERIALAGFSQGGAVALHVALRYPRPLAGVVALSCYLVSEERLERERSDANRSVPIFQAHGTHDPMVPLRAGELARDLLVGLGYDVSWRSYPMGHEVVAEEIAEVGTTLKRMLGPVETD